MKRFAKGLLVLSIGVLAIKTPSIMRRYDDMKIIDKKIAQLNEKANEKKSYIVIMYEDAIYSVGIMALIGTLSRENRRLWSVIKYKDEHYVQWKLTMNTKQKIAFEETAKDYLVSIVLEDEEPEKKVRERVVIVRR